MALTCFTALQHRLRCPGRAGRQPLGQVGGLRHDLVPHRPHFQIAQQQVPAGAVHRQAVACVFWQRAGVVEGRALGHQLVAGPVHDQRRDFDERRCGDGGARFPVWLPRTIKHFGAVRLHETACRYCGFHEGGARRLLSRGAGEQKCRQGDERKGATGSAHQGRGCVRDFSSGPACGSAAVGSRPV